MGEVLVCWLGNTDLRAAEGDAAAGLGPIGQAVTQRSFDAVHLLSDYSAPRSASYVAWLRCQTSADLHIRLEPLSSPTHIGEIHDAAVRGIREALGLARPGAQLAFHLSPGTPAMAAVWILLAKTRFPAELIESSLQKGVVTVSLPFEISADFLPDLLHRPDRELERLSQGLPPEAPEFADILHHSPEMQRVVARARRVAPRSVPVLIEGESGTGKEFLARAIHRASPRREKPFVAVNCGAIPSELVESELFGHERGAFTGADGARKGHFEEARGSTLFLDEVGELPALAQVKLLRVLQEGEVVRVGSSKPVPVDVRVIAATNRELLGEVAANRFRADLFYRLAVAVLRVPSLRERQGDLGLLVDALLAQANRESASEPGYRQKHLSVSARNLLFNHPWPGNVRELSNTLRRAAIWTPGEVIDAEDVREALLPALSGSGDGVLNRPLGQGLSLPHLLAEIARHYLERALVEAQGNKTRAASLVGLPSYQTLTNWLQRYAVVGPSGPDRPAPCKRGSSTEP